MMMLQHRIKKIIFFRNYIIIIVNLLRRAKLRVSNAIIINQSIS